MPDVLMPRLITDKWRAFAYVLETDEFATPLPGATKTAALTATQAILKAEKPLFPKPVVVPEPPPDVVETQQVNRGIVSSLSLWFNRGMARYGEVSRPIENRGSKMTKTQLKKQIDAIEGAIEIAVRKNSLNQRQASQLRAATFRAVNSELLAIMDRVATCATVIKGN